MSQRGSPALKSAIVVGTRPRMEAVVRQCFVTRRGPSSGGAARASVRHENRQPAFSKHPVQRLGIVAEQLVEEDAGVGEPLA